MTLPGIDLLKDKVGREIHGAFEKLLGIRLEAVEIGFARLSCLVCEQHLNTMERAHGGLAASMLDSAMGCAVMSTLNPYAPFGTIQLNVHFVRKIDLQSGRLTCEASAMHVGQTMRTVDAKIIDAEGRVCAHGTGTFLVYPT